MSSSRGTYQCLRWLVFIINFVFWLIGLGTLGIGLWLLFDSTVTDFMNANESDNFNTAIYLLVVAGMLMSLVGFLGCIGALRESQCMLVSFFIILVLAFCLELACAIIAYTHQDTVQRYIDNSMYEAVHKHYGQRAEYTKMFDQMQSKLKCCGVKSYKDWLHSSFSAVDNSNIVGQNELGIGSASVGRVPRSCCNDDGLRSYPTDCGLGFDKLELWTYEPFLHAQGCSAALYSAFNRNLDIAIGVSVVVGALQLLGMVLSMVLCCWLNYRDTKSY